MAELGLGTARFMSLAGLTLVLVALALSIAGRITAAWPARFSSDGSSPARRTVLIGLVVALVVNLPLFPLSAVSVVRSLSGDLSITSMLLLAAAIARRGGWLASRTRRDQAWLLGLILIGSVVLYPASLGLGAFDPFRWGFSGAALLGALLGLALVGLWLGAPTATLAIALAVLAWSLRLNASTNLWTYLLDPMLGVYAVFAALRLGWQAVRPQWSWHTTALLLTALLWLTAGLIGREPWKADEAYSFGVVFSMIDGGHWLIPTLAGEPFVEKPPFMFWLAALWAKLPVPGLAAHELARMANVSAVLGTLIVLAVAARRAGLSRGTAVASVILLTGMPVFLVFTRYLTADLGLLPAAALVTLGLVLLQRQPGTGAQAAGERPVSEPPIGGQGLAEQAIAGQAVADQATGRYTAGLALGAGLAMGFLSKGMLLPAVVGLTLLLMVALSPTARSRAALRHYAVALLVFMVLGLGWPLAMWVLNPEQFGIWFWENNVGRFLGSNRLGPPNDRWQTAGVIAVLLLPAWPLALQTVWHSRRSLRSSVLLGPMLFAVAWLGLVLAASTARGAYALPAVVPLALLAAPVLERWLKADWPRLRWVLTGLATVAVIVLIAMRFDARGRGALIESGLAGVMPVTLTLTAATVLAWILASRAGQRSSIGSHWVVCLTVVFATAVGTMLPAADRKSGFSKLFLEASSHLKPGAGCVASIGLGESERGMLHYYTGIQTRRTEVSAELAARCPQVIEQQRTVDDASRFGCRGGREIWSGGRPGNTFDRFRVCARP